MASRSKPPRSSAFIAETFAQRMSLAAFYDAVGKRIYGNSWPTTAAELLTFDPRKWLQAETPAAIANRVRDDVLIAIGSGHIKVSFTTEMTRKVGRLKPNRNMLLLTRDTSGVSEQQLDDPSFDLEALPPRPFMEGGEQNRPEPVHLWLSASFWNDNQCLESFDWVTSTATVPSKHFVDPLKFSSSKSARIGEVTSLRAPALSWHEEFALPDTIEPSTLFIENAPAAIEAFFQNLFLPDEEWCERYRKSRHPMMLELTNAGWRFLAFKRAAAHRVTIKEVEAALNAYVESQGMTGTGPKPDGLGHLASTMHAQWIAQDGESSALINTKREVKGNRAAKPK